MRVPALLLTLVTLVVAGFLAAGCGGPDEPKQALAKACERQREQVMEAHDSGSTKEAKSTEEFVKGERLVECAGQPSLTSEMAGETKDEEPADGAAGGDSGEPADADDSAEPALDDAMLASMRESFSSTCASCHALGDADATGAAGPNLDESTATPEAMRDQIVNGGGGMPPGLLQGDDAEAMAAYIAQVRGS